MRTRGGGGESALWIKAQQIYTWCRLCVSVCLLLWRIWLWATKLKLDRHCHKGGAHDEQFKGDRLSAAQYPAVEHCHHRRHRRRIIDWSHDGHFWFANCSSSSILFSFSSLQLWCCCCCCFWNCDLHGGTLIYRILKRKRKKEKGKRKKHSPGRRQIFLLLLLCCNPAETDWAEED